MLKVRILINVVITIDHPESSHTGKQILLGTSSSFIWADACSYLFF